MLRCLCLQRGSLCGRTAYEDGSNVCIVVWLDSVLTMYQEVSVGLGVVGMRGYVYLGLGSYPGVGTILGLSHHKS